MRSSEFRPGSESRSPQESTHRPPQRPSPWKLRTTMAAGALGALLASEKAYGQELGPFVAPHTVDTRMESLPSVESKVNALEEFLGGDQPAVDGAETLGRALQTDQHAELGRTFIRLGSAIRIAHQHHIADLAGTGGTTPEQELRTAATSYDQMEAISHNAENAFTTAEEISHLVQTRQLSASDARRLLQVSVSNTPADYGHPLMNGTSSESQREAGHRQVDLHTHLDRNELLLLSALLNYAPIDIDRQPFSGTDLRASDGHIPYAVFQGMYLNIARKGTLNARAWDQVYNLVGPRNHLDRPSFDRIAANIDAKIPLILIDFFHDEAEAQRLATGYHPPTQATRPQTMPPMAPTVPRLEVNGGEVDEDEPAHAQHHHRHGGHHGTQAHRHGSSHHDATRGSSGGNSLNNLIRASEQYDPPGRRTPHNGSTGIDNTINALSEYDRPANGNQ